MALSLVTAPTVEPITLEEAKLQCREPLDVADNDALIDTLIKAARRYVETFTRRALLQQTWDWKLDGFPGSRWLALQPPLANVTAITSITYTATDGTSTVWTSSLYATDLPVGPQVPYARIAPAYNESYPATRDVMNAVVVRFVAGYGTAMKSVPEDIKVAIKLMVGHWFINRESVLVGVGLGAIEVPMTAASLLWPYRVED